MLGSASDLLYQPDGLVRQAKLNGQPVIYVGINYRLGGMQNSWQFGLFSVDHTSSLRFRYQ